MDVKKLVAIGLAGFAGYLIYRKFFAPKPKAAVPAPPAPKPVTAPSAPVLIPSKEGIVVPTEVVPPPPPKPTFVATYLPGGEVQLFDQSIEGLRAVVRDAESFMGTAKFIQARNMAEELRDAAQFLINAVSMCREAYLSRDASRIAELGERAAREAEKALERLRIVESFGWRGVYSFVYGFSSAAASSLQAESYVKGVAERARGAASLARSGDLRGAADRLLGVTYMANYARSFIAQALGGVKQAEQEYKAGFVYIFR